MQQEKQTVTLNRKQELADSYHEPGARFDAAIAVAKMSFAILAASPWLIIFGVLQAVMCPPD